MNQKHNVTAEKLGIQISSGTLAGLAGGAVTISMGETSLFVSATAAATLRPGQDFFPLTVDYREKFTAAGRFPGGYFKREGRPSEKEILTSRLCDRPLRPLFPKGFLNEVQVIGYLLSTDLVNEADVLMVNGASAALLISDVPWDGPVGCVRLGEIDGEFVVNPTNEQMYDSTLDLIYVGSEKEMMMIEGSADQIPEDRFVAALEYAHEAIQDIIGAQRQLAELCAKEKKEFDLCNAPDEVLALCREITGDRMDEAIFAPSKQERQVAVDVIKDFADDVGHVHRRALKQPNMSSHTANLMGILPLFLGMRVKVTKKILPPEIVQEATGEVIGITFHPEERFGMPGPLPAATLQQARGPHRTHQAWSRGWVRLDRLPLNVMVRLDDAGG